MPKQIAIAIVHGIGKQEPHFWTGMAKHITASFAHSAKISKKAAEAALVMQPVYWAPVLQAREELLWTKLRSGAELDFISLRRFMVEFAADAMAYQPLPGEQTVYANIHGVFADALANLVKRSGPNLPLVVIAHSLGTVITSNYFYDLLKSFPVAGPRRTDLIPPKVMAKIGDTPFEHGQTLSWLFTMGSPIALWSLRYENPTFGVPITVPAPAFRVAHPGLRCGWVNILDEDDVIGYPLKPIYGDAILQDKQVNSGGLLSSWNPLSHDGYWDDEDVTEKIGKELAAFWKALP
ncbi:MAG: chemotaxis protein [Planctomycetota bacterium]